MWVIVPEPTKLQIVFRVILALVVISAFLTFMHLFFARGDLEGLNGCERLGGISDCTDLHGTYDEIYADCVAWPPVFTEQLSGFTERLCDAVLSEEGTH